MKAPEHSLSFWFVWPLKWNMEKNLAKSWFQTPTTLYSEYMHTQKHEKSPVYVLILFPSLGAQWHMATYRFSGESLCSWLFADYNSLFFFFFHLLECHFLLVNSPLMSLASCPLNTSTAGEVWLWKALSHLQKRGFAVNYVLSCRMLLSNF